MSTTSRRALVLSALVIAATGLDCTRPPPPATAAGEVARPGLFQRLSNAADALVARKISSQYDESFVHYSKQYFGPQFDWRWFKAQGFAESRLDPHERSWVGARGLMQLMPTTYHEIVSQNPEFGPIDQPSWNIAAGIYYNRRLWDFWHLIPYDERLRFMFASYNAGRGPIIKAYNIVTQRWPQDTTWANVVKVAPSIHPWIYRETIGYVRRIEEVHRILNNPFVTRAVIDTL